MEKNKEIPEKKTSGVLERVTIKERIMNRKEFLRAMQCIKGNTDKVLPVEAEEVYIQAELSEEFAGPRYGVRLFARIYKQKNFSPKWVVLLHPNRLSGSIITNNIGYIYYERGYNILAPDLRGFGKSEGRNAMGFLESLDTYEWIEKINEDYEVNQIIVHGLSLGGAVVNYLSGIDQFLKNGPVKVRELNPISNLHVQGLIVDSSYVGMKQFAGKAFLVWSKIGLTNENFDYYSDASKSLCYSEVPMMIIHGTKDHRVKIKNADQVEKVLHVPYVRWNVEGEDHVFVLMGRRTEEYREKVVEFEETYGIL